MAPREPLLWQFSRGDDEHRAVRMQATIAIDATPPTGGRPRRRRPVGFTL
jgi:hypothetical protein